MKDNKLKFGDYVKIKDETGFFNNFVGRVVDCQNAVSWISNLYNPNQNPGLMPIGLSGNTTVSLDQGRHYTVRLKAEDLIYDKEFSEDMIEKLNALDYMKVKKAKND